MLAKRTPKKIGVHFSFLSRLRRGNAWQKVLSQKRKKQGVPQLKRKRRLPQVLRIALVVLIPLLILVGGIVIYTRIDNPDHSMCLERNHRRTRHAADDAAPVPN